MEIYTPKQTKKAQTPKTTHTHAHHDTRRLQTDHACQNAPAAIANFRKLLGRRHLGKLREAVAAHIFTAELALGATIEQRVLAQTLRTGEVIGGLERVIVKHGGHLADKRRGGSKPLHNLGRDRWPARRLCDQSPI